MILLCTGKGISTHQWNVYMLDDEEDHDDEDNGNKNMKNDSDDESLLMIIRLQDKIYAINAECLLLPQAQ